MGKSFMNVIYLMRHGESSKDSGSLESTLTDKGIEQVSQMGEKLKENGIKVEKVYHSGLMRAEETASIVREIAFPHISEFDLATEKGIAPQADPELWKKKWEDKTFLNEPSLFISHLPFLPKLVDVLLKDIDDYSFSHSSIMCIEQDEENNWEKKWNWSL